MKIFSGTGLIFLFLLATSFQTSAQITVTNLAENNVWHRESTYTIQWTAAMDAPETIQLSLLYDSSNLVMEQIFDENVTTSAGSYTFTVPANAGIGAYYYIVAAEPGLEGNTLGRSGRFSIDEKAAATEITETTKPAQDLFTLQGNIVNNALRANYNLKVNQQVALEIYDLSGKQVLTANEGNQNAGAHTFSINTSTLNEGIYICRLNAGNSSATKKFIISRK
jgi:hypothetical protein